MDIDFSFPKKQFIKICIAIQILHSISVRIILLLVFNYNMNVLEQSTCILFNLRLPAFLITRYAISSNKLLFVQSTDEKKKSSVIIAKIQLSFKKRTRPLLSNRSSTNSKYLYKIRP